MPESVQSCFELSRHFPVFFPMNYGLVAVHGWFAIALLRCSETRFRSSGAGNTLPVSIPRNAVAQLKMADNHGRTTGRN